MNGEEATGGRRNRDFLERWLPSLLDLARDVRTAARQSLLGALDRGEARAEGLGGDWLAPAGVGVGDTTYGLDRAAETALDRWLHAVAQTEPVSLFSEDMGWRHLGPRRGGGVRELPGFDHGGARIVVDPVDGTRNLMSDLRSAWTAVAVAPPGPDQPRASHVALGLLSEIPDSRGAKARVLYAGLGAGAHWVHQDLAGRPFGPARPLVADGEDRADHGYFPFFRYAPDLRPAIARVEAAFFERLRQREGADVRNCWDDQYIASAGQLALLALGTYRMVVDLRPLVAERLRQSTQPSKPYDVAGALLVAREAGCAVLHPEGGPLDFPLDGTTPVAFAGFHGEATRRRLLPHLLSALAEALPAR